MARVKSDQLVYLAVGVPANNRQAWRDTAIGTLERRGFAVMEMTPADIVQQADHIKQTYEKIKGADTNGH